MLKLVRRIGTMRAEERYAQVKLWAGKKQEIPDMLSLMNLWYRDVLVAKAANGSSTVLFLIKLSEAKALH